MRFFNRLGATEVDPDTSATSGHRTALEYATARRIEGFDPRPVRIPPLSSLGSNPSASAPHQHEHWLNEASCPVVWSTPSGQILPKPGRSTTCLRPEPMLVLAFAFLYVLWRDGLMDRRFLSTQTIGFASSS